MRGLSTRSPRAPNFAADEPVAAGAMLGGCFGSFRSTLAAFQVSREGETFASPHPARHPGRKVTTCLGEEGNRQQEESQPTHRAQGRCQLRQLPVPGASAERDRDVAGHLHRHGSTGGSSDDPVLGSGSHLGTQQGFSRLSFLLGASPGEKQKRRLPRSSGPRGRRSLPCQRSIPPAPWQRAEQLVQSGRLQKAL